ncbi:MAG: glutaminyl-peptide cyclotransferase [Dehalococcoidia bacterium]|nr:glutaminyl-peptide cyclotransferase [Dehalococcoidia bacterium]
MVTRTGWAVLVLLLLAVMPAAGCLPAAGPVTPSPDEPESVPVYGYRVVNTYPHDPGAFTQGLVFEDGVLYEGIGREAFSSLRKVELETGKVLQVHELPDRYFGEGITIFGGRVIQLTWRSNKGFVYDKESFELIDEFAYPIEGWGLTHDGDMLIMSDGSDTLHFLDPTHFEITGEIRVTDGDLSVRRLNELEYIDGVIYANIWQTDRIAMISPENGRVTGWIDLEGILQLQAGDGPADVLNGIAYDAENDRLFVTGKLWPRLFEIQLVPQERPS